MGVYGIAKDITKRKKIEKQMERLAYYDTLTGLPNRYLFNQFLKKAIGRADRKKTKIAIMFIDLDRFKMINDTKGHNFGDIVLKEVAKRLVKSVRQYDIVSRQGGDEFIILLEDIDRDKASKIAERIIHAFSKPFKLDNQEFFTTASIGISLYPTDGLDEQTLIKYADTAMYLAKDSGKNNYKFYSNELNKKIFRKMILENGLRKALSNNEFILYYQPQIDLSTARISGMEALIRWKHPKYGLISPAEFIPVAEETGLIIPIGKWVLETACKQTKEWHNKGFDFLNIAVNISIIQVHQKDFVDNVKQILNSTGLDAKYLELEVTESIMKNNNELKNVLNELKEIGVKVAIDDFGMGYSSLSVLKKSPIDNLKIDQYFVSGILNDDKEASLLKTIIDMGYNLDCNIIAEGIENKNQLIFLKENRCNIGQGYLFSKPLPANEVYELLKKNSTYDFLYNCD